MNLIKIYFTTKYRVETSENTFEPQTANESVTLFSNRLKFK